MCVGVNEGALLDALARTTGTAGETVRRAQQFTGDIGAVVRAALTGSEAALREIKPRVGHPLKPMLAQSAHDVAAAFEEMSSGQIALEYKLDGARVQIHKRGDEIKIFSRHLSELTQSLPEIVDETRRGVGHAAGRGRGSVQQRAVVAALQEQRRAAVRARRAFSRGQIGERDRYGADATGNAKFVGGVQ